MSTALRVGRLDVQHTICVLWSRLAASAPGGRLLAAEAITTLAETVWNLTPAQATQVGSFAAGIGLVARRYKPAEANILVTSRAGLLLPGRDKAALAILLLGLAEFKGLSFPALDRARKSTGH